MASTSFLDRFRVDGRVAIITGAGRGIGAASARALASCGADVVITARTESQLEHVAGEVEALGRKAIVVAADANDLDQLAATVDVARDAFGRVDIVVNNVGGTGLQPFLETTPGFMEAAFHFNVSTAFALSRAAVPLMLKHDGGSIVNIASVMHRFVDRGSQHRRRHRTRHLPGRRHLQGDHLRPGLLGRLLGAAGRSLLQRHRPGDLQGQLERQPGEERRQPRHP